MKLLYARDSTSSYRYDIITFGFCCIGNSSSGFWITLALTVIPAITPLPARKKKSCGRSEVEASRNVSSRPWPLYPQCILFRSRQRSGIAVSSVLGITPYTIVFLSPSAPGTYIYTDSYIAFNAGLCIFAALLIITKEPPPHAESSDDTSPILHSVATSRPYLLMAADALRHLDPGNLVIERCVDYLMQLEVALERICKLSSHFPRGICTVIVLTLISSFQK